MSEPIHCIEAIRAIEAHYLPGAQPTLMERAGRAAADWALELLPGRSGPILVAVGPGNNGGDALVAARHLKAAGREVVCALAGDPQRFPADAAAAWQAWRDAGGESVTKLPERAWALAIDGLFGIGLKRPPEGLPLEWIDRLGRLDCPVLALDLPSGLDADSGQVLGRAVRASHTLTFIGLKPGLLTLDGPDHCGEIRIADLGLPAWPSPGQRISVEDFRGELKPRPRNSHKGDWGEVGILGGAPGMLGAAWLAGRAALALGAGRVYVGALDESAPALDPLHPELMMVSAEEVAGHASVLAVGPGLGRSETALRLLRAALDFQGPLLLDADALNLLGSDPQLEQGVRARTRPTILTPHPAEAARLLQQSTREVQNDRLKACRALAARYRCEVVLKGCGSILASPDGAWAINTSGHPGMGAAGMGDVLSGLVASLLAQGWEARQALHGGVHLHGAAADACSAAGCGPIGLSASELIGSARATYNRWLLRSNA
ncbi:NAD(P)H-hydrate dehydratase [Niveibacterium terrae]|uniref:NAD(P)H-hydrate dehydratase n=1 Tax=Niveibacterium terrae TaxID=3373598 RepID=UPI003A8EC0D0